MLRPSPGVRNLVRFIAEITMAFLRGEMNIEKDPVCVEYASEDLGDFGFCHFFLLSSVWSLSSGYDGARLLVDRSGRRERNIAAAIDGEVFQDPLHVIPRLVKRNGFDPVNRVLDRMVRIAESL